MACRSLFEDGPPGVACAARLVDGRLDGRGAVAPAASSRTWRVRRGGVGGRAGGSLSIVSGVTTFSANRTKRPAGFTGAATV